MKALTRLTSFLMVFLGVGIMVRTVDAGGGAAAVGILVGLLFVAAGAGRLYLTREQRDPEEPHDIEVTTTTAQIKNFKREFHID